MPYSQLSKAIEKWDKERNEIALSYEQQIEKLIAWDKKLQEREQQVFINFSLFSFF